MHSMNEEVAGEPFETSTFSEATGIHQGTVFGSHYQIICPIGRGGMGMTFKALDTESGAHVAAKFLLPERMANPKDTARFAREAKTASRLSHPFIARVLDFGLFNQSHQFLIMEYVEGETLAQRIEVRGQLPVDETLDVFIQVCDALSYAHAGGVLHRDIKPSNMMVAKTSDNTVSVKLLDFGLAKLISTPLTASQQLTNTGEVVGSPFYMSPEQARGGELDARSDLYSLGCALYEALTGGPPHLGQTAMATLLKRETDRPLPLGEASLGKAFPEELEKLVSKLLKTKPEDRYQTAEELQKELSRIKAIRSPANSTAADVVPSRSAPRRSPFPLKLYLILVPLVALGFLFRPSVHEWLFSTRVSPDAKVSRSTSPLPTEQSIPEVDLVRAANLTDSGDAWLRKGEVGKALEKFSTAVKTYKEAENPPPDKYELALEGMAYSYAVLGNFKESANYEKQAIELLERRGLSGADAQFQLNCMGTRFMELRGVDTKRAWQIAKPLFARALLLKQKYFPEDKTTQGEFLYRQAKACLDRGMADQARWRCERALELSRTPSPKPTLLAATIFCLSGAYQQLEMGEKVPPLCKELTLAFQNFPEDSQVQTARQLLYVAHFCSANSIRTDSLSAHRTAETAYQVVLPVYSRLPGVQERELATTYDQLGSQCLRFAKAGSFEYFSVAEGWLKKAIDRYKQIPDPPMLRLAHVLRELGEVQEAQKNYTAAATSLQTSVDIYKKISGPQSSDCAKALAVLGKNYQLQGNFTEAEACYRKCIAICKINKHTDSGLYRRVLASLGTCKYSRGQPVEATAYLEKARQLYIAKRGHRSTKVVSIEQSLAKIRNEQDSKRAVSKQSSND